MPHVVSRLWDHLGIVKWRWAVVKHVRGPHAYASQFMVMGHCILDAQTLGIIIPDLAHNPCFFYIHPCILKQDVPLHSGGTVWQVWRYVPEVNSTSTRIGAIGIA